MLHDPAIAMMSHKLVEASVRQRVIAHNLANAETPHYKAFRVVFDEQLAGESGGGGPLKRTDPRHLGASGPHDWLAVPGIQIVRDTGTTLRNDANNVDIDVEMAALSANTLYYSALTTMVARKFAGTRAVIQGFNR